MQTRIHRLRSDTVAVCCVFHVSLLNILGGIDAARKSAEGTEATSTPLWQANTKANMIHFANTSPFKLFPLGLVWLAPLVLERNKVFFFSRLFEKPQITTAGILCEVSGEV